jgi:chorismate mutase/prephenate dehydrogenase
MSDGEKGGREQLESLRREVRRVDSGILDLVAERMALVQRIGEVKKGSSIPLRDFSVEKEVLEASDRRARERSLSPELARRLMRLLIVESVLEQERLHYSAYSGDAERVLVVGGLGTMGRWLARFFANQGHEVLLHDRAPQAEEEGYCPARWRSPGR